MRNSISHPKNAFEGIRSRNSTKLLCLSPEKKKCAREITSLAGSYSHEELNLDQGLFGAIIQLQPLPWDDSLKPPN